MVMKIGIICFILILCSLSGYSQKDKKDPLIPELKDEYIIESDTVIRCKTYDYFIVKGQTVNVPTLEQYSEEEFIRRFRDFHREYIAMPRILNFFSIYDRTYKNYIFKIDGPYAEIYYYIEFEGEKYKLYSVPQRWKY